MISGDRWMLMWRSAPGPGSFTQLVSQPRPRTMTGTPRQSPLDALRATLLEAAAALAGADGAQGEVTLERPRRAEFGDYSTNAAMVLARGGGRPPRELAEELGRELAGRLGADLERYEVAGPGFLNLFLGDGWLQRALAATLAAGPRFGAGRASRPQRINV